MTHSVQSFGFYFVCLCVLKWRKSIPVRLSFLGHAGRVASSTVCCWLPLSFEWLFPLIPLCLVCPLHKFCVWPWKACFPVHTEFQNAGLLFRSWNEGTMPPKVLIHQGTVMVIWCKHRRCFLSSLMLNALLTETDIWRMPFLTIQNTLLCDRKSYGRSWGNLSWGSMSSVGFFHCIWLGSKRNSLPNSTILAGKLEGCFLKHSKGDSQTSLLQSIIIIIILKHKCQLLQDEWYCVLPVRRQGRGPSPQRPCNPSMVIQYTHVWDVQTETGQQRRRAHKEIQIKYYWVPRREESIQ